jgi:glycosyltransferase involved in cell wall biosynthesis
VTLRLGFACLWEPVREATWSYTPWHLRRALLRRPELSVTDVGVTLSPPVRTALRLGGARRTGGRWRTTWRYSAALDALVHRQLELSVRRSPVDVVFQVQDLSVTSVPFVTYQDLSYDVLLGVHAATGEVPHFGGLSFDLLRRRRDRQHALYAASTCVFTMSSFLARSLVEQSGVPAGKVHVLHPGRSTGEVPPDDGAAAHARLRRTRRRLLFVGRDFHTKGGDIVVAAHRLLHAEDPRFQLTVAGPAAWPLSGAPPVGVRFVGAASLSDVERLYDAADLLVVPSRLEGFGKVFVEALARGLPCVARDAFAMPEIVEPGLNGALVVGGDPQELAVAVRTVLADQGLYERTWRERHAVAARYSWERAAGTVVDVLSGAGLGADGARR